MTQHGLDRAGAERDASALGAAADRAREVQRAPAGDAAGEDEPAQRRQLGLEPIDQRSSRATSSSPSAAFVDARGDLVPRIGELRAEREQIALDLDEHLVELGARAAARATRPSQAFSSSTSPYASTRGVALRHARAVEQRRLAGVAGPACRFSWRTGLYDMRRAEDARRRRADRRAADRRRFRQRLLDLVPPARPRPAVAQDRDPYHILVSEIMLQQTQVDRVLPKYARVARQVPVVRGARGRAGDEVVETWYPLGYNIRPRRLQAIAREAVAKYGGQLPADEATLLSFKGIGAYTAGASAASRSASAPRFSTPTSRACCSASSSARAIRRATR